MKSATLRPMLGTTLGLLLFSLPLFSQGNFGRILGTYTVRVEAPGFQTLNRENVVIEVGKEVRVDLTPRPGEQTQSVTITEAVPLVDTASATLGGTLANAEINDMPLNGRNYQNLLGLRPGVMLQPGGSPWT